MIGEAPGAEEASTGAPFVGSAGQKLFLILQDLGVTREDVSLVNVLRCNPPGNKFQKAGEKGVKACLPAFRRDLELAKAPFVVALGTHATKALIEKPFKKAVPISQLRGHSFEAKHEELKGVKVYPTYHPSYLHYAKSDEGILDALYGDLEKAFSITRKEGKKAPFLEVDDERKRSKLLFIDTEDWVTGEKKGEVRLTGYADEEGIIKITEGKVPCPTKKIVNHFVRHDYVKLRLRGDIPPDWPGELEDTILLCQMLDENRDDYSLKSFAAEFGYDFYWRTVHGYWDKGEDAPKEDLLPYNAIDVELARRLYFDRRPKLGDRPRVERNYEFLSAQLKLLCEVELNGLMIHPDAVKVLRSLKTRVKRAEKWIRETYELNPKVKVSGNARKEILFGRLGLPVLKKTKELKQPKTDKHTMARLAQLDKTGTARRYHRLSELKAQEKDIAKLATAAGTLLHPEFNLGGRGSKELSGSSPVTGRLSSQDPNMQNVPKWARVYIISRYKQGKILRADAKQIEIKAAYEYSKDPALIVGDTHTETMLFMNGLGILIEKGKRLVRFKVDRQGGKKGNFSVIYGAEEANLMESYGIPFDAAREVRRGLKERFHVHFDWIDRLIQEGKLTGEIHSLSGHVRRLPMLKYGDKHAINQGVNFPIQNWANILNLCAASHFGPRYKKSLLINLVHDELVYDCETETMASELEEEITDYWARLLPRDVRKYFNYELSTSYQVEIHIADSWVTAEELKKTA